METRKKPGPAPRPMPEQIPDTPENVARILMKTPPKKREEWKYLRQKRRKDK